MVARQQDLGDLVPAPLRGLGVERILQQAAGVRLLVQGRLVADHAREQPRDRLGHGEHGDLAAVEHVVAETEHGERVARPELVVDALVDPLVAPAGEDQPVVLLRHPPGDLLGEDLAARSGHDHVRGLPGTRGADGVERLAPGLGPHDHAGAAAVRRVVDGAVPVVGPVAQVVDLHLEQALPLRPPQQRELQRSEVVGEDRDDVDAQRHTPHSPSSSSPGGGSTTTRRASSSISGTSSSTKGTS